MRSKGFNEAFQRLAAEEEKFLTQCFLAPVLPGHPVRVRIAGVVCTMQIVPSDFQGWGVFRPKSLATAEFVRHADLGERRRYLQIFPRVRLVLCRQEKGEWLALSAHRGDRRFRIEGLVPVRFVDEAGQFETALARFDGANFWFEQVDPAGDAARASYLRQSLVQLSKPNQLDRAGLTPEEKGAYAVNYCLNEEVRRQTAAELAQERLRQALDHAGAELVDFLERADGFRVTFTVGGQRVVSAVRKDDLSVQVAGICLSGRDNEFDLASLVGVIREGGESGEIVPVGAENRGMQEDQYWHVHPRDQ
jgi:hypothetical protein